MKKAICKHIFSIFFLISAVPAFSQNLDLIVEAAGDSIACRIDSIKENIIYFEMKFNHKWIITTLSIDKVLEYQYNVINKKAFNYKQGTSIIDSPYLLGVSYVDFRNAIENPQALSTEEFDLYYNRAIRFKKNGAITTWGGLGAAATGYFLFAGSWAGVFGSSGTAGLGLIMLAGGSLTTIIGIPIYINGAYCVSKMNKFRYASFKEINLQPKISYGLAINHYYPSLNFTFIF